MNHAQRRAAVAEIVQDGVLILVAAPEHIRSHDSHHSYRPSSDMVWLTGFEEPAAVAVFAPSHPKTPFVLFTRPRNKESEIWDGRRWGPEGAVRHFGADAAYNIDELDARLPDLVAGRSRVFYALGTDARFDQRVVALLEALRPNRRQPNRAPGAIVDPRPALHRLRMIKDADEIATMRRAAIISAEAHVAAMRATRPGRWEYEIQAELEYHFLKNGARSPAYGSIVAGGSNACVLHYHENDAQLRDGELLLVDAACEYQWYASDITRTWPVGARFTPAQRDVYAAVLDVNKRIIDLTRVGQSKESLQRATIAMLTEHLITMGLLRGSVDENVASESYRRFYMHGIGHYLGLDVHDVGDYFAADGGPEPLRPGMLLTVEPGLYIGLDEADVPAEFRGIGVRIEDDILITSGDPENLTPGVPKEIEAIEALRAESLG